MIRILVVDDHDILRGGVVTALECFDDFEVVGQAADGRQAVDLAVRLQPDVVLMDLVMPKMDGLTAVQLILQECPALRIIALTSYEDDLLVQSAQRAGISRYLLKDVTMDEMAGAIRSVYADKPGPFMVNSQNFNG